MESTLDTVCLYNQTEMSDIVVSFGGREVKCHKLVLGQRSEYFKPLCIPKSNYEEGRRGLVELRGDDPDAVEAVLRYIYGLKYVDYVKTVQQPKYTLHMNVYIAADKYLLPDLAEEAMNKFKEEIQKVDAACENSEDATKLLDLLKLLSKHEDLDESFGRTITELKRKHLPALFSNKEFRDMLDDEDDDGEGKATLGLVLETLRCGTGLPNSIKNGNELVESAIMKCKQCPKSTWLSDGVEQCGHCGNRNTTLMIREPCFRKKLRSRT